MARIRTIHPDYLSSESMSRIDLMADMFFPRLWMAADDAGLARANVPLLAAQLFPRRKNLEGMLANWLDELEREQCIKRYTIEDVEYLWVVNWKGRQKICHPSPSRLPPPPGFKKVSRNSGNTADNSLDGNDNPENSRNFLEENPGATEGMTAEEMKRAARDVYVRARARGDFGATLRAIELARRLDQEPAASRADAVKPGDTGQNDLDAARATQAALAEKSNG